nr:MAG TPA: hypothetical protein [Caudoviricetes sp.]
MLHAFTSSHSGGCNGCRFSAFISIFIISKCNTAALTENLEHHSGIFLKDIQCRFRSLKACQRNRYICISIL